MGGLGLSSSGKSKEYQEKPQCVNYIRHGPEYKGNVDFTEVLCKKFPAYHYKHSQTFLQMELSHRQTFETERIFDFFPKSHLFFTKMVKKRLNLDQN